MTQNFKEKRRHPRIEKNVPLKIKDEQFDIITETKNISCSGAYCQVNKFLPAMTKVRVTLLLPLLSVNNKIITKKIRCKGIVVRSEPDKPVLVNEKYSIAIFFNDISAKDMANIAEYVNFHIDKTRSRITAG
ncbi:MAG: PilZ domain-containing protein [Candidatus Omnitrophota bacterium]